MNILAIESSCDETAAAIVKNGGEILSSVVNSQVDLHKIYGGVVPEIASRKHVEAIAFLCSEVFRKASLNIEDIDALAVTYSPGLIGSLLVGVNFVKGMSIATGLPVVPVNHLKAHIAANYLEYKRLEPPFLGVVASGGHTSIFEVLGYTELKLVGNTRDDAIGETFDKVARVMEIPYPGGANLDKLAESGDELAYKFTTPRVEEPGEFDMSFSGLKTQVINLVKKNDKERINLENLAASFRKVAIENLVEKVIKAAASLGQNKIVLSGGVAANALLRRKLKSECFTKNFEFFAPSLNLCSDNAAMVGAQAYYEYIHNSITDLSLNALPRF